MNENEWKTPHDMKITLGLNPNTDNRTLNRYVKKGKLEICHYSQKVKQYRKVTGLIGHQDNTVEDDWTLDEAA